MNFEVDRYSSAWAHIALCADLTWASEPPDEFIVANQRLWAQHCRVSQVLHETTVESSQCVQYNQSELSDKRHTNIENGNCSRGRSVKDVIPESRLAQHYGNFFYDESRENCYTNANYKLNERYNGHGCEKSDLTECWMLPEVEYWFRKLVDDTPERSVFPRRRRQYRMPADDDFERWGPIEAKTVEEAKLASRIRNVRELWAQNRLQAGSAAVSQQVRALSPPPASRKIRARRRQPRRLGSLAPPPPPYCLDLSNQLLCDPSYKFDVPRQPQMTECQRAIGRLSANVQAVMRAAASRCPPYRGTQVSRYAPTGPRPLRCPDKRYGIWWPRDHPSPRLDHKFQFNHSQSSNTNQRNTSKPKTDIHKIEDDDKDDKELHTETEQARTEILDCSKQSPRVKVIADGQEPSTSSAAIELGRKKRLYSTVLSMSAPPPLNLNTVGCVRLSQKLVTPGLIKLNPKLVLSTRIRAPNADKFEELEKEALEQYKASDESIDTKFSELEKQAVEQYSTSNSNTSCSSDNSTKKKPTSEDDAKDQAIKFHKGKSVDSVVIYSQNFPDLNNRGRTKSIMNLKNLHAPQRGEKKEQLHRSTKSLRNLKNDSQRAASDTDYEARDTPTKGCHKGAMRWTLHVMPPKKRHLSLSVSDLSSDEDIEETCGSIRDAGACIKNRVTGKVKMSAHGGGDLHPLMRKT